MKLFVLKLQQRIGFLKTEEGKTLLELFLYNKYMIVLKITDNLCESIPREAGERVDSHLISVNIVPLADEAGSVHSS